MAAPRCLACAMRSTAPFSRAHTFLPEVRRSLQSTSTILLHHQQQLVGRRKLHALAPTGILSAKKVASEEEDDPDAFVEDEFEDEEAVAEVEEQTVLPSQAEPSSPLIDERQLAFDSSRLYFDETFKRQSGDLVHHKLSAKQFRNLAGNTSSPEQFHIMTEYLEKWRKKGSAVTYKMTRAVLKAAHANNIPDAGLRCILDHTTYGLEIENPESVSGLYRSLCSANEADPKIALERLDGMYDLTQVLHLHCPTSTPEPVSVFATLAYSIRLAQTQTRRFRDLLRHAVVIDQLSGKPVLDPLFAIRIDAIPVKHRAWIADVMKSTASEAEMSEIGLFAGEDDELGMLASEFAQVPAHELVNSSKFFRGLELIPVDARQKWIDLRASHPSSPEEDEVITALKTIPTQFKTAVWSVALERMSKVEDGVAE